ncbi:MAG: hypothetical protein IJ418_23435 [Clostridia bacterium]|nr:hypothetical protein [Clostridia bacterium]
MPFSPYALLRASKPNPPASYAAQYDLYSLAHSANPPGSDEAAHKPASAPAIQAQSALPPSPPAKKTHYIADIHARHTRAMRQAPQSPP